MSSALTQIVQRTLIPQVPAVFQPILSSLLAADQLDRVYGHARNQEGPFLSNVLKQLSITYRFADADRARVPNCGAAIVVANHPTGVLDGIVLAEALRTGCATWK